MTQIAHERICFRSTVTVTIAGAFNCKSQRILSFNSLLATLATPAQGERYRIFRHICHFEGRRAQSHLRWAFTPAIVVTTADPTSTESDNYRVVSGLDAAYGVEHQDKILPTVVSRMNSEQDYYVVKRTWNLTRYSQITAEALASLDPDVTALHVDLMGHFIQPQSNDTTITLVHVVDFAVVPKSFTSFSGRGVTPSLPGDTGGNWYDRAWAMLPVGVQMAHPMLNPKNRPGLNALMAGAAGIGGVLGGGLGSGISAIPKLLLGKFPV